MIPTLARPCGYQMVDSVQIRNFRSFENVKIDRFRRVNLIVGDNGSGKTAFLEALFLAAGVSPELSLRTRTWRGADNSRMQGSQESIMEGLWSDLFHKFHTNESAFIALGGADHARSVTIKYDERGIRRIIPPSRRASQKASPQVIHEGSLVEFVWNIGGYGEYRAIPRLSNDGIEFVPPPPPQAVRASFFAANRNAPSWEAASRFSALSRSFVSDEFNEKFKEQFRSVSELSVEMSAGQPLLFGRVDYLPQRIPLGLASGGMNKLASMLLAMADQQGGVILIDEVESGFYYQRMPKIWEALLDFARHYECQVFVSTHSNECLRALAPIAEKNASEFSMLRTVMSPEGTQIRYFDGLRFAQAILDEIEVR